jgi:hypothetical protein
VARTITPIVTSRIAVTTVAAASFWKRVKELLGPVRMGVGVGGCGGPPARSTF